MFLISLVGTPLGLRRLGYRSYWPTRSSWPHTGAEHLPATKDLAGDPQGLRLAGFAVGASRLRRDSGVGCRSVCKARHEAVVELLIGTGAMVDRTEENGYTPLSRLPGWTLERIVVSATARVVVDHTNAQVLIVTCKRMVTRNRVQVVGNLTTRAYPTLQTSTFSALGARKLCHGHFHLTYRCLVLQLRARRRT